jgi:hypothetical protein
MKKSGLDGRGEVVLDKKKTVGEVAAERGDWWQEVKACCYALWPGVP